MNESLRLLPFRRDQPPRRVIERYPGAESMIASLWHRDSEFREICRDYRDAVVSLRLCEQRGTAQEGERASAELVAELEREMLAMVERHF